METPAPLSILQISDLHILPNPGEKMLGIDTERYFKKVLEHAYLHRKHYDLILVSGDLAQDPCRSCYERIREQLQTYRTECICLPGNHDDDALMREILTGKTISCAKQRVFDRWQLLCLNSRIPGRAEGFLEAGELAHLETELAKRPDLFALIAVHHHCVPTDSDWLDTMIITNREHFLAIIERHPQVKAVTMGHIHQVMDRRYEGIRLLSTPATCFQFKPNCRDFTLDTLMPGYRVLELHPDGRLNTQIQRLPGTLEALDTGSSGY